MDENQTPNQNDINSQAPQATAAPMPPATALPQQIPAPVPPQSTPSQPVVSGGIASGSSKKSFAGLKALPLAIGIALLVVGGSVGAYLGVIMPNKPENVLKTAFENTAKQTQVNFNGVGKFESTKPNADIKAFNIEYNGKVDSQKNIFQTEMKFTASGVSLPVDIRKVDTSLYLRFGDLKTIQNLAGTAAPEYAQLISLFGDKISNQWIEIDETLLKQSEEANCALNTSLTLTDGDIELLKSKYESSPFITTDSTSSEDVNGRAAFKYDLTLNAAKANEFGKVFDELSAIKALKECSRDDSDITDDIEDDTEDAKITLWVDKQDKTITKIRSEITENEADDTDFTGFVEITMSYDPVTIEKPEGARPAMDIISELQATLMDQYGQDPNSVQGVFDFSEIYDEAL